MSIRFGEMFQNFYKSARHGNAIFHPYKIDVEEKSGNTQSNRSTTSTVERMEEEKNTCLSRETRGLDLGQGASDGLLIALAISVSLTVTGSVTRILSYIWVFKNDRSRNSVRRQ